jgi:hypothetical protein
MHPNPANQSTARETAVAAFLAAHTRGEEPWEAAQAAFLSWHPKLGWDEWTREIRITHPSKPLYGYRLPLGHLVGVPGAEGYGWHSRRTERPESSKKLRLRYSDATISRMRELAGLWFRGQVSMPFL